MKPYLWKIGVVALFCTSAWAHGHGKPAGFPWDFLQKFSAPFSSSMELWLFAFMSTALISAAPFFILFFIPLHNATQHTSLLKVLLSFASGGLLGDAFLHLIPHAISPHDHSGSDHDHTHHHDHAHHHDHDGHAHHHDHGNHAHHHGHDHMQDMIVGLWVLLGIISFLAVEKFVRLAKGGHGHSHSHAHPASEGVVDVNDGAKERSGASGDSVRRRKGKDAVSEVQAKPQRSSVKEKTASSIKVSAYLNLAADFAHNFTDGLAIGASYLAGREVGLITTFTILIHEIPHEIGDFAILIQSGYSRRRAMFLQLGTAVGAMAGTACGLFLEGVGSSSASAWVLPFTAGGFIYIATVSVIPELLEKTSVLQSLLELVAMTVGIAMMVFITFIE